MRKTYFLSFVPPSKANSVKINSRHISKSGKRYIIPKDVSLKINKAIWELQLQRKGETFNTPVKVEIVFILPNKRRRDLDNIMKTLGDCLVYAGILEDDNLIFEQVLKKYTMKGQEGVIIKISTISQLKVNDRDIKLLNTYKENLNEL